VVHFLTVGLVVSGLMIHVYMGAVFPEERQAFYSMVTGMVSELYAYHHHFKWWREVKIQEEQWQRTLRAGSDDPAPSRSLAKPVAEPTDRRTGEGVL